MWQCQACKRPQAANAHRVVVTTQLANVNFIVTNLIRAKLPEVVHLCGDCGLKAGRALQSVLQG